MNAKMTVWKNHDLSERERLKRNYEFWSKKCDQIAHLYEQKNEYYDKAMKEMIGVGREYSEIMAKCRRALEEYFNYVLDGMDAGKSSLKVEGLN